MFPIRIYPCQHIDASIAKKSSKRIAITIAKLLSSATLNELKSFT